MTDIEYTEQALDHLGDLEDHVVDRVLNKVDEATEWTNHRLDDWFDGNVVVLEAWGFCATFFNVFDDIDAGELLEIAADDAFVVAQFLSEGAN